jgi:hypothetical protein
MLGFTGSSRPGRYHYHQRRKARSEARPLHTDSAKLIGSFKGKIKTKGNVLNTGVKWDAES